MAYSAIGFKQGWLIVVLVYSTINSDLLQAQVVTYDAAATQQREKENRERLEQLRRLNERPKDTPSIDVPVVPEEEILADTTSLKFFLTGIEFSPSEWLSKKELDQLVTVYVGKESSFANLNQLVSDVNQYYRSRGIVTAQAILQPQKITDGMVKITLVEGRVGKVVVTDNNSTNSEFITNRFDLSTNELIRIEELEQELARFNRVEDIQLRAQMEKGSEFGTTDIVLKAIEQPQHIIELFAGNTGTDETGETREGIRYTNKSVLGYRDRLTLSALGSSGNEGYVFSYNMPVNRSGGRLGFNYLKDDLDIDSEAFSELDIEAASRTRSLDFIQPIYSYADSALSFSMALEERKSSTSIDDFEVTQSEVESLPLRLQWDQYFERDILFFNASFNRGRERKFDDRYFSFYQANLTYLRIIGDELSIVTRLTGQYSGDENLPGGQTFQIGGATSVRGYEEGLIGGDKGAFANIELQWNLSSKFNTSFPINVTSIIFIDQGVVYPFRPDASVFPKKEFLGSVGTGFSFDIANSFFGSITVGFPVREDNFDQDRSRVHFNVTYRNNTFGTSTTVSNPDRDGDGVYDAIDRCPLSPVGQNVDATGCNIDVDKDGILDSVDQCLGTPATDKVEATGCSVFEQKEVSINLDILFAYNSSVVTNPDSVRIQEFVAFMARFPNTQALIEGHASAVGDASFNQILSENRAQSVRMLLSNDYNIDASRLQVVGYGESQLKDKANTAEANSANRRIEVKVTAVVETKVNR